MATSDAPTENPVSHRRNGPGAVVELRGEIDLATAPTVWDRFEEAIAAGTDRLTVDLRPVTFIDCSGLRVLCRAHARLAERGGRLRVVADSSFVLRLLGVAGLLTFFDVHPHLPGAPTGPDGPALGPVRP
ncbi:STAS domain-containing protein [Streptomyces sp. NBC_01803]|uniref:STAS domain-containing protein n=1 Tax=Streptomyces sp. NBC_01803 TaxID=2975946 RepID=UPI002DD9FFAA|nr:STAS domain-containing protein [Streptomyces sp. NBC_01803]WSA47347.1 STAS domain-containing protein [Streptomyces sp. NBC_01803]